MIEIDIPGRASLSIEHLVLDYNGTIAVDGIPLPGVLEILMELSRSLKIHVITADTHGTVRNQFKPEAISIHVLEKENQPLQKKAFITQLGASRVVAIGNGYNDHLMLQKAAIGIAVLQQEGLSLQALLNADLLFTSIVDALDCFRNPMRITASLRR